MKKRIYLAQRDLMTALLREVRVEAGVTQVELAARIEKDQAYVSRYESGQRRLDVLEVREICQALGITLEEFVKRLEKILK
jgi:transcriptional regulator with XRE-family HTH domain